MKYDPEQEEAAKLAAKRSQIKAINDSAKRQEQSLNEKQDNSIIGKFISKIIDNFQLKINRIHIRLEDRSSNKKHPFALGILLKEIHVLSVDKNGAPTEECSKDTPTPGMIRKHVTVNGFSIYLDSDQEFSMPVGPDDFIDGMRYPFDCEDCKERNEPIENVNETNPALLPQQYIIKPIYLGVNLLMDTRGTEVRKPSSEVATNKAQEELGLNPMNKLVRHAKKVFMKIKEDNVRGRSAHEELGLYLTLFNEQYPKDINGENRDILIQYFHVAWRISNTPNPVINVGINMNKICINLEKNQYRDLMGFLSAFSMQSLKAKYLRFHPEEEVKASPKKWWKFAYDCVCADLMDKNQRSSWDEYIRFKKARMEYIELWKRNIGAKGYKPLKKDTEGLKRMQEIEDEYLVESIMLFRKMAEKELKEETKKAEATKSSGWFGFGSSSTASKESTSSGTGIKEIDEFEWNDEKQKELLKEMDISEDEVSPWIGGNPDDVQILAKIKFDGILVSLKENSRTTENGVVIPEKVFFNLNICTLGIKFVKTLTAMWADITLDDINIEDTCTAHTHWPQILYTENKYHIEHAIEEEDDEPDPLQLEDQQSDEDDHPTETSTKPTYEVFVDREVVYTNHCPFLQLHFEMPALDKSADMKVRISTLPLFFVANMPWLLGIGGFFSIEADDEAPVSFKGYEDTALSMVSQLKNTTSGYSIKEAMNHTSMDVDIHVGATTVIVPENCTLKYRECRAVIARLGEINVITKPIERDLTAVIPVDKIYDIYTVNIIGTSVSVYRKLSHFNPLSTEKVKDRYNLVYPFDITVNAYLNIAPNQCSIAAMKVDINMDQVILHISPYKYKNIMDWQEVFLASMAVPDENADANSITEANPEVDPENSTFNSVVNYASSAFASEEVDPKEAERQKEKEKLFHEKKAFKDINKEDLLLLQEYISMEANINIGGFKLILEETQTLFNELHPSVPKPKSQYAEMITIGVDNLHIFFKQRTYDQSVLLELESVYIHDGHRERLMKNGISQYMFSSKRIDDNCNVIEDRPSEEGAASTSSSLEAVADKSTSTKLISINVFMVNELSPIYQDVEGDIVVKIHIGPISFFVNPSTLYNLVSFFFSEVPTDEINSVASKSSMVSMTSSISAVSSAVGQTRDYLVKKIRTSYNKKTEIEKETFVSDWERNNIYVSLDLDEFNLVLNTETPTPFLLVSVNHLHVLAQMAPKGLSASGYINDFFVEDKSASHGLYPYILRVLKNDVDDRFMSFDVVMFNNEKYPLYPGYSMDANVDIKSPEVIFRFIYVNQILQYIQEGPLNDMLGLMSSSTPEAPAEALEVIEEVDEDEEEEIPLSDSEEEEKEVPMTADGFVIPQRPEEEKEVPSEPPFVLPLIHVVLENVILTVPRNSNSQELIHFELGTITIENSAPTLPQSRKLTDDDDSDSFSDASFSDVIDSDFSSEEEEEDTTYINPLTLAVTPRTTNISKLMKDSLTPLNSLMINLEGMRLTSSLNAQTERDAEPVLLNQAIMGGVDMHLAVRIDQSYDVALFITKIAFAISEKQVQLILAILAENMTEKVEKNPNVIDNSDAPVAENVATEDLKNVVVSDDLKDQLHTGFNSILEESEDVEIEESSEPAASQPAVEAKKQKKQKEEPVAESAPMKVNVNFTLEGMCLELLYKYGGYPEDKKGTEMFSEMGNQSESLAVLDIGEFKTHVHMVGSTIHLGLSLSHIEIMDNRHLHPVDPHFAKPIKLGTLDRPCMVLLMDYQSRHLDDYKEMCPDYVSFDNFNDAVTYLNVTLRTGPIRLLPTSLIFDILKWKDEALKSDAPAKEEPAEQKPEEKKPEEKKPEEESAAVKHMNMDIYLSCYFEKPTIYIVENPAEADTSVYLFTLDTALKMHLAPDDNIDLSLRVENIRGCRSNKDLVIAEPTVNDGIQSFAIFINVTLTDSMNTINGSLTMSDVIYFRFGVLDLNLFMNFLKHLYPEEDKPKQVPSAVVDKPATPVPKIEDDHEEVVVEEEEEENKPVEKPSSMAVTFNVSIHNMKFTIVNDAFSLNLPVLEFDITNIDLDLRYNAIETYINIVIGIYSEYYNKTLCEWEPLFEPWTMFITLTQLPKQKDRLNALANTVSSVSPNSLAYTNIAIHSDTIMNVNVSIDFMTQIFLLLNSLKCSDSKNDDCAKGYYISIFNNYGRDIHYRIVDDGKIDYYIKEKEQEIKDVCLWKQPIYTTLLDCFDIKSPDQLFEPCYLELYDQKPYFRLFNYAPISPLNENEQPEHGFTNYRVLLSDTVKILPPPNNCIPNTFVIKLDNTKLVARARDMEEKEELFIAFDTLDHTIKPHVPLYQKKSSIEAIKERKGTRVLFDDELEHTSPVSEETSTKAEEESDKILIKQGTSVDTCMPAHPSLPLKALSMEDKYYNSRKIEIFIDKYDPFIINVDLEERQIIDLCVNDIKQKEVIVHVDSADGMKVVYIESNLCLHNLCNSSLFINMIENKNDKNSYHKEFEIKHDQKFFIPPTYIQHGIIELMHEENSKEKRDVAFFEIFDNNIHKCYNLYDMKSPHYIYGQTHVEKINDNYDDKQTQLHTCVFSDILKINNNCPLDINYKIYELMKDEDEGDQYVLKREDSIKNGCSQYVNSVDIFQKQIYLSIYTEKDENQYIKLAEGKHNFRCLINNNPVYLTYIIKVDSTGLYSVTIYSEFLFVNRTSQQLIVKGKDGNSIVLPAANNEVLLSETIPDLPEYMHEDESHVILPQLFGYTDPNNKKNQVQFTINEGSLSDPVTLTAIGIDNQINITDSTGHQFIYNITIKMGPEQFIHSYVVSINNQYLVKNETNYDILFRQDKMLDPMHLSPRQIIAYNPPSCKYTNTVSLTVQKDNEYYCYSNSIDINKLGEYYIVLEKDADHKEEEDNVMVDLTLNKQRDLFKNPEKKEIVSTDVMITVNVSKINEYICVVFRPLKLAELPYCISNSTLQYNIFIQQEGALFSSATCIPPASTAKYIKTIPQGSSYILIYVCKVGEENTDKRFKPVKRMNIDEIVSKQTIAIHTKNFKVDMNIYMDINKASRLLIFEDNYPSLMNKNNEYRKHFFKNSYEKYYDRFAHEYLLVSKNVKSMDHVLSNLRKEVDEERKMNLFFDYASDLKINAKTNINSYIEIDNNGKKQEFKKVSGSLAFYNQSTSIEQKEKPEHYEFHLCVRYDALSSYTVYTGVLDLSETKEDQLYYYRIPTYSSDANRVFGGYVYVYYAYSTTKLATQIYQHHLEELKLNDITTYLVHLQEEIKNFTAFDLHQSDDQVDNGTVLYMNRFVDHDKRALIQYPKFVESNYIPASVYTDQPETQNKTESPLDLSTSPMMESSTSVSVSLADGRQSVYSSYIAPSAAVKIVNNLEKNKCFSVILNNISNLACIPDNTDGIYVRLTIGSTSIMSKVYRDIAKEEKKPSLNIVFEEPELGFNCVVGARDKLQVDTVYGSSTADTCGLHPGYYIHRCNNKRLIDVEGLERFNMMTERALPIEFTRIAKHDTTYTLPINEKFTFPRGCTKNETKLQIEILGVNKEEDTAGIEADQTISHHELESILYTTTIDIIKEDTVTNLKKSVAQYGTYVDLDMLWIKTPSEDDISNLSVDIVMEGFGLSLIDNDPKELLYLSSKHMVINFKQLVNRTVLAELKVGSFQIDNQLVAADQPVFVGSTCAADENTNFLALSLCMPYHPSVTYIEFCSILMQEIRINSNMSILIALLSLVGKIPSNLLESEVHEGNEVIHSNSLFIKPILVPNSIVTSDKIFIETLELQPIQLVISNKIDANESISSSFLPDSPAFAAIGVFVDTVSGVVGNIDQAKICLNALFFNDILKSTSEFQSLIISHYVSQFIKNAYKIVTSVDIIGSPINLIDNVGSGVKAFFYEPAQGLVQGPGEFAKGLGRGTKKLVSSTAYGVLNSASKVTGTVGNLIANLSYDQEFKEGRAEGKKGFVYGLTEGFKGVVKNPIKGAKENGALGAIKGIGTGLLGVIVKPVTGIIDEVNNAIESGKVLTNEELTLFRQRPPRFIYYDSILRPYERYSSFGALMFYDVMKGNQIQSRKNDLFITYTICNYNCNYLMISDNGLYLCQINGDKEWYIRYDDDLQVDHYYNELLLKNSRKTESVICKNVQCATVVCEIVKSIVNKTLSKEDLACYVNDHLSDLFDIEVPIPRDNLLEYSYVYDTTPFDIQYVSLHTTRLIYNRTGDNKYIKKDNQVDYEYIIDVYGVDPNTDRIYKWQVYKLQHALDQVMNAIESYRKDDIKHRNEYAFLTRYSEASDEKTLKNAVQMENKYSAQSIQNKSVKNYILFQVLSASNYVLNIPPLKKFVTLHPRFIHTVSEIVDTFDNFYAMGALPF